MGIYLDIARKVTEVKTTPSEKKEPTPHPEKYQNMTLDDFEKENTLIKVYSKILDETVYFASNDEAISNCGTLAGMVYIVDELRELIRKKITGDELRLLHEAKKEFNGKIIKE